MIYILLKYDIKTSLYDHGGLIFCDPPSFRVIFSLPSLLKGSENLRSSPIFHLPSPLLISDRSLIYRFFYQIVMSKQILPVVADSFRYLLILLATSAEIFKAFLCFLRLNRKKTSHLHAPPPRKKIK